MKPTEKLQLLELPPEADDESWLKVMHNKKKVLPL